jgi:hypothetical protein
VFVGAQWEPTCLFRHCKLGAVVLRHQVLHDMARMPFLELSIDQLFTFSCKQVCSVCLAARMLRPSVLSLCPCAPRVVQ